VQGTLYSISVAGHIQLTAAELAASAANNIIVLLTLNICTAFLHPGRLVSVRSGVEKVHLLEEEGCPLLRYSAPWDIRSEEREKARRIEKRFEIHLPRSTEKYR